MSLDKRTVVMYGWKAEGRDETKKLCRALERWDAEYYDKLDGLFVEDTMCGEYIYFGAQLVYYDSDEDHEVIITQEIIEESTKRWNDFIKENPKLDKILKRFKNGDPQLYVFSHIW